MNTVQQHAALHAAVPDEGREEARHRRPAAAAQLGRQVHFSGKLATFMFMATAPTYT